MTTTEVKAGVTVPGIISKLDSIRDDIDAVYSFHQWQDTSPHAEDIARNMSEAIGSADALRDALVRVNLKRGADARPVTNCKHGNSFSASAPCKLCEAERSFRAHA
jgi:hypothetical protein